ncbi:hypothetical protein HPP92_023177 [Vanilla planifolia]|uniref:Uncharacterized protein n=1 Tax=Vanilla planifolia TaxID=51239 RepID=A0A835PYV8_VANPL|nr:hypothetical protein HPP92_023177 [Vanilla planifolia]
MFDKRGGTQVSALWRWAEGGSVKRLATLLTAACQSLAIITGIGLVVINASGNLSNPNKKRKKITPSWASGNEEVAKISKWAKRSKSLCISLLLRSGGSLTVGD